jgi:hypothetical protein
MRDDQRQRIRVAGPGMEEMNTEAVDLGAILIDRVQPSLASSPVVAHLMRYCNRY